MSDQQAHEVAKWWEGVKLKNARKLFPLAKTDGEALNEYYKTAEGQQALTAGLQYDYEKMQKTKALGDGYEIAKAQPEVRFDNNQTVASEDGGPWDKTAWDKKIASLMKDGMSYDAAATHLYRQEKASKGQFDQAGLAPPDHSDAEFDGPPRRADPSVDPVPSDTLRKWNAATTEKFITTFMKLAKCSRDQATSVCLREQRGW